MCVIVIKDKYMPIPSSEILYQCFTTNPDGAGFMYNFDEKVFVKKGFMDFHSFYDELLKVDEQINLYDKSLVIHFRISTSGGITPENCHPYPISESKKMLKRKNLVCKYVAFCHNGIITKYKPNDKELNDTQTFSIDCLSQIYKHNKRFYKNPKIKKMLNHLANSKLCFLDNNGDIETIGTFYEYEGITFSNLNFARNYERLYSYNDLQLF